MKLKQSPFLRIVPMDDEYVALYHSLNLEVAFLRKAFIEQCQQGQLFTSSDATSKHIVDQLKKFGLLIEEQDDGYELYRKYQKTLEEPAINILYLLFPMPATFVADTATF